MKICPKCQAENKATSRFCCQCGDDLSQVTAEKGANTRRLSEIDSGSTSGTGSATRRLPESETQSSPPIGSVTKRLPNSAAAPIPDSATRRLPESEIQPPVPTTQAPPPPPPSLHIPPLPPHGTGQVKPKPFWQNRQILWLSLLGIFVLAGAAWGVMQFSGGFSSSQVLVADLNRGGDIDLYLLELGGKAADEQLLAEKANYVDYTTVLVLQNNQFVAEMGNNRRVASFLPNSRWLLFAYYNQDEELMLQQMQVGDEAPANLYDTKRPSLSVVHMDSDLVTLREDRDGNERCYAALFGEELDRVAKSDSCYFSEDGSAVFMTERNTNSVATTDDNGNEITELRDVFTLVAMDIDGANQMTLIDTDEPIGYMQTAWDGSHVAYVKTKEDQDQLYLVDRATATVTAISSTFSDILAYGFAQETDRLFYIGVTEDDLLQLYTTDDGQPLAEGSYMQAVFNKSGTRLLYVVGDDVEDMDAYIFNVETRETTKIVSSGERFSIAYVSDPESFLLTETLADNEMILRSSNIDGTNVQELFTEDAVVSSEAYQVIGGQFLYLQLTLERGQSLFVTPFDRADGFYVIDEWSDFTMLNVATDEAHLTFSGQEDVGDDVILYGVPLVDGERIIEMDDETQNGVLNAAYMSNGDYVLYTAITGNDYDDSAIKQVQRDGESRAEIIYDKRILIDVAWDELEPFQRVWFSGLLSH